MPGVVLRRERGEDGLNLDPNQERQAAHRKDESERAVSLRLAETYQRVLVPSQPDPLGPIKWDKLKVDGQHGLAVRASGKLVNEAHLYTQFPAALLRQRLDSQLAALWADGHVTAAKLWDAFSRFLYLPRLRDQSVLLTSIGEGAARRMWQSEGVAVADAFEESTGRYLGLTAGRVSSPTATTLVVAPTRAVAQLDADLDASRPDDDSTSDDDASPRPADPDPPATPPPRPVVCTRFHVAVFLDPERRNRDFPKVSDEVISHLTRLVGADVTITVEIAATSPDGFPDSLRFNVEENAKVLRFDDYGFKER